MLLTITHHYVRNSRYPHDGIHPLTLSEFRESLRGYPYGIPFRIINPTPEEIDYYLESSSETGVLLTFDDGLADHVSACDILDEKGIKAVFFVPTYPYESGQACFIHKLHWIRATTDHFRQKFLARLNKKDAIEFLDRAATVIHEARALHPHDTDRVAAFKHTLTQWLDPMTANAVVSQMLSESEEEFTRRTYLSPKSLAHIASAGHAIGLHGHTHIPFPRLHEVAYHDVMVNRNWLTDLAGEPAPYLSYPYGRGSAMAFDADTLCKQAKIRFGFTTQRGVGDRTTNRYHLPRVDCRHWREFLSSQPAYRRQTR